MSHRFICQCVAEPDDEGDCWTVTSTWHPTAKCHTLGEHLTGKDIAYARMVDAEWDRAEATWLDPSGVSG